MRSLWGLMVAVAAWPTFVALGAQAPPPRIAAFLELCETSRRGAIVQAEQQLRALKAAATRSASANRQIRRLEQELQILRERKQLVVPALRFPPEPGAIGRLPKLSCHVDQVLSDDAMLVRCYFNVKVVSVERFQARGDTVVRPVVFLLRGTPTKEAMEGADLELSQVFEVLAHETFRTADGRSAQALGLREFDLKRVESYLKDGAGAGSTHP